MKLDGHAARAAVSRIGERLGLAPDAAAAGIFRMALESMTLATKALIAEKGYDPRDFSLVSFGGGGSLFTASIARELGIREVVVPRLAPVFSAWGAAMADTRRDAARTVFADMPADPEVVEAVFRDLEADVTSRVTADARGDVRVEILREADLRFAKQTWEVTVPFRPGPVTKETVACLERDFLEKYERLYGKGTVLRESGIQLVNARVIGYGRRPAPELPRDEAGAVDPGSACRPPRTVWVPARSGDGLEPREIAILDGARLKAGMTSAGPAIIEYPDTTIFVPEGMEAAVDELGSCVIR
jgi:N-methylhydantoinase A